VQSRLRGRVGEKLSLTCRNELDRAVTLEITLIEPKGRKARFGNIPEFYVWIDVKTVDENIGYIRFNAFMDPVYVMSRFNEAMQSFREAEGIIIDVRGNGGGIGEMGMGMIGWLVDEGQPHLGTVIFRDLQLNMIVNPRPRPYRGPVVVLIDEKSVSAAEFFASGIKDLGRAHLIGTRTAGAALGSSIEKLPNGDGFQYAAVNYVSNKTGKPLEGIGVIPDTEVTHTREALLEGRDLPLEAAIKWIREQNR
jgi:carboxyl-terminal processing protease